MYFLKSAYGKVSLVLILLLISLSALFLGSAEMTFDEFVGGLLKKENYETASIIIYSLRLPRIFGALIAGGGLALSGLLLQRVTNNDLASPNIIGVNSGAGLGVIVTLSIFPTAMYSIPFAAFLGAFLTTLFIVCLASKNGMKKSSVILIGVAVTAMLNAVISFMSYRDADLLSSYNYFSVGGLSGIRTEELIIPFIIVALSVLFCLLISSKTDTMMLGDSISSSLGVNVKGLRVACLIVGSACAGAAVSFAGLLGFVGLVVPHIAGKIAGYKMKDLVPVSVLLGGILMVMADVAGRTIIAPSEIPVGIVMAFIGAPFFFWILLRRGSYD